MAEDDDLALFFTEVAAAEKEIPVESSGQSNIPVTGTTDGTPALHDRAAVTAVPSDESKETDGSRVLSAAKRLAVGQGSVPRPVAAGGIMKPAVLRKPAVLSKPALISTPAVLAPVPGVISKPAMLTPLVHPTGPHGGAPAAVAHVGAPLPQALSAPTAAIEPYPGAFGGMVAATGTSHSGSGARSGPGGPPLLAMPRTHALPPNSTQFSSTQVHGGYMATPFPSSAAFGSSALLPPPLPTFPPPVTATAGSSASGSATTTTATSASGGAGVDGATLSAPVAGHKRKALRTCAGEVWEDPTLLEWPENDYRLFCGDLGNEVTDEMLGLPFKKYASFAKAKVVRDPRTHKSKGYGFVSFLEPMDALSALKEMNGSYIGNRPIRVKKSTWNEKNYAEVKKKDREFKKRELV